MRKVLIALVIAIVGIGAGLTAWLILYERHEGMRAWIRHRIGNEALSGKGLGLEKDAIAALKAGTGSATSGGSGLLTDLAQGGVPEPKSFEQWWSPAYDDLAKAHVWITTAKELMAQGKYEDVIKLMDEIASEQMDDEVSALAHLLKGICLWGLGQKEAAVEEYKLVILDYPNTVAAWEAVDRFGLYHLKAGTVFAAMEWVADVLEADPTNFAAKKAKWELVARAARMADIAGLKDLWAVCMDGLKGGGETVDAYEAGLTLAMAMKRMDRTKAFELLNEVAQNCPDPSLAGEAKLQLAMYSSSDVAIQLLTEVLASDANDAVKKAARRSLAIDYMGKDVGLAAEMFEQVMRDGWTEEELCLCLTDMGLRALNSTFGAAGFNEWLGELGGMGGTIGEHALLWQGFLEDPTNAAILEQAPFDMLRSAAMTYVWSGRADAAEAIAFACLAKANAIEGDNLEKYMQSADLLAAVMMVRGQPADAAAILGAALEKYPDDPRTAVWMLQESSHLSSAQQYSEAVANCELIVKKFPESVEAPRALYFAAYTSEQYLRDLAKAREMYQRIVKEYPESSYADTAESWLKSH